jgi:Spy/CpxP family protein refolding chaperone
MKSSLFCRLGAIVLSFFTLGPTLKAQDATNSTSATGQQRRELIQQLDLSDAQKAQIKQIRQSTPKGKERREAIMAILTPEQKAQLMQDFEQKKAQHQAQ